MTDHFYEVPFCLDALTRSHRTRRGARSVATRARWFAGDPYSPSPWVWRCRVCGFWHVSWHAPDAAHGALVHRWPPPLPAHARSQLAEQEQAERLFL
jgi:hypothetical protein